MSRRENNRIVFERLWRGTFQAVVSGPQRRARASSHDPTPESQAVATMPLHGPSHVADSLEPALRTILEGLRQSCCCRCSCNTHERNFNDNLQVCLSNEEERKSMRSVIRCAYCLSIALIAYTIHRYLGRQPLTALLLYLHFIKN